MRARQHWVVPGRGAGADAVRPGVRALGVYLCVFQHLPYDRGAQALRDIAGASVSPGSLNEWVAQAADGLCDFDERLRELLAVAPVAHFDETGARIAGRLGWVHSASTDKLTRYTAHARRGSEAIDAAGILPDFEGVAIHDGWAPYRNYPDCDHGLCNVHHLRELQAATEAGHVWPLAMSCLLLDTKDAVGQARGAGAERLDPDEISQLAASFTTIIAMGHEEHPTAPGKRSKAHNLLLRLERYEPDVLRFAHDFRVPFSNNQAEQDIRMVKLQQKISGCWRTPKAPSASWPSAATSPAPARTASTPWTRSRVWPPGSPGCPPRHRPDGSVRPGSDDLTR